MAKAFIVSVVSQDRNLFEGEVLQISATADTGEIGILAGHTPLMATLKPGQVRLILPNNEEQVIYVSGGFIEVQPQQTIILADEAARAVDLDEAEVKAAIERAQARMKGNTEGLDEGYIHSELAQLSAQLSAIRRRSRI